MTTAHTPGPWIVEKDIGSTPSRVTFRIGGDMDAAGRQAAISSEQGIAATNAPALMSTEEAEANARLIAAAPELLAALQTLANSLCPYDTDPKCWANAMAAIAKATGGAE